MEGMKSVTCSSDHVKPHKSSFMGLLLIISSCPVIFVSVMWFSWFIWFSCKQCFWCLMLRRKGIINLNLHYNLQLHNFSRGKKRNWKLKTWVGPKAEEIKPRIVNQHSVVCCFKCDLCDSNYDGYTTRLLFQRIADHRYSAIGRHLRDAHGNIDLLNESQFWMLKNVARNGNVL